MRERFRSWTELIDLPEGALTRYLQPVGADDLDDHHSLMKLHSQPTWSAAVRPGRWDYEADDCPDEAYGSDERFESSPPSRGRA